MNKLKFWIFEAISIICFVCFCIFTFTLSIASGISKLLALSSFVTLILAFIFMKTEPLKRIKYVFLQLLIYAILFFIFVVLALEFSNWSLGNIYLILI